MKKLICCAALTLAFAGFIMSGMQVAQAQSAGNLPKVKELRIERSIPPQAIACLECHKQEHPGIFNDWANSRHANANVTCYDCHMAEEHDGDVSPQHYKQYERSDVKWGKAEYKVPVAAAVTPKDCSFGRTSNFSKGTRPKTRHTAAAKYKIKIVSSIFFP